ncbi:VanZ family protein [Mucilaginibacter calamicampi]|uniref:VanZ family protein n=1 Tax=Mucilaginibacter calamicampi TaxID=1302352 RepID=A0ABW2YZS1_9SPHI
MRAIIKNQRLTLWWALFVFIICNIQIGAVGKSSLFFPGFDKLAHCGLFFVFVVFCTNGFIRQNLNKRLTYKNALFITLIGIGYGGLIELVQLTLFSWRTGDWDDLFADTVGACMATFSILITINATNNGKK